MSKESERLQFPNKEGIHPWKKWGPYVAERAWGTVREDYSAEGDAWRFTTHDMARSLAYRWNEDGLAGICDSFQILTFSLALWNGKDPILKERLYGLNPYEGNHGEDVKELYYYLDSTPTHSYMKFLYKYPQEAFPYERLIQENQKRSLGDLEFELLDTGIFNEGRYFDVFVEYAKEDCEDIAIRIEICNRGREAASLHFLPQLTFRNRWTWEKDEKKSSPSIRKGPLRGSLYADASCSSFVDNLLFSYRLDSFYLYGEEEGEALFTNNETNYERLYGTPNKTPYVKDAFHRYLIQKEKSLNPKEEGTKAALHYQVCIEPGASKIFRLRLTKKASSTPLCDVDSIVALRKKEADEFYCTIHPSHLTEDEKNIQRQALAGMLWSKQFYHYNVDRWLEGDPAFPPPPESRERGRNCAWRHLRAKAVLSVPDKWEYPWFASWDLCFHCVTLGLVDLAFAKEQLQLLLTYHYQSPSGQIPAYEWEFSDLNPPVQAWAALKLYEMDAKRDVDFLQSVFSKLLVNFTWWENKVDKFGNNFFEGGFLGLDNISIIDRSCQLPNGEIFEESDGTGWMGFFTLLMMRISRELSMTGRFHFQETSMMFLEYFTHLSHAFHTAKGRQIGMWDEQEGFLYDTIRYFDGTERHLKIRSLVGIIPFYSFDFIDEEELALHPKFHDKFHLFLKEYPKLCTCAIHPVSHEGKTRYLLSLLTKEQKDRALQKIFDPSEFLSPYGIRSLSKIHASSPVHFERWTITYEPGESLEKVKGGNSNWRGPIWFPTSILFFESLLRLEEATSPSYPVLTPEGTKPLSHLIDELKERMIRLFRRDATGARAIHTGAPIYATDPYWKDLLLFYEHYHAETGRGLGASHQTGWSGLIALLLSYPNKIQEQKKSNGEKN